MDINEARQVLRAINTNPALQAVADRLSTAICRYETRERELLAEIAAAEAAKPDLAKVRITIHCRLPVKPATRRALKPFNPFFTVYRKGLRALTLSWASDACPTAASTVISELLASGQSQVNVYVAVVGEANSTSGFTQQSGVTAESIRIKAKQVVDALIACKILWAREKLDSLTKFGISVQ
jgi:hypothetical protein